MRKSILLVFVYIGIFATVFAQRIVKSAVSQYPSCNDIYYNFEYDYAFNRFFNSSDGARITISTNKKGLSITKWNNDLAIVDKKDLLPEGDVNFYYTTILDDVIYLFGYEYVNKVETFCEYEISVKNSVEISIKKASKAEVFFNKGYEFYTIDASKTKIEIVNRKTSISQTFIIPVKDAVTKTMLYETKGKFAVLSYISKNTAVKGAPSNSVTEVFVFDTDTKIIKQPDLKILFELKNDNGFSVAAENDSLFFIIYSNEDDYLKFSYKVIGYDFGLNTNFLSVRSSTVFSKKIYQKKLATVFFEVDPRTKNIILVLERFDYHTKVSTLSTATSRTTTYSHSWYKGHRDYAVIYMNPAGNILNVDFLEWTQTGYIGQQTMASFFPKIMFVDGLLYCFVSHFSMKTMTCVVYESNGTRKDFITLFENDKTDSDNVNVSTINYIGSGNFVFATIPNKFGKTGCYYIFKVYK